MASQVSIHTRMKTHRKMLDALRPIEQKERENPKALAYFVAVPAKEDDGTVVAIFEIFEDAAADAHLALPEMSALRKIAPHALAERPFVQHTKPLGKSFVRSGVSEEAADSGLTILVRMTCAEGTDMSKARSNFADLVEYCDTEEPQTLAYHYSTSEEQPNTLFAFEQFESGQFCMGVHMKTNQFVKASSYASDALTRDSFFAKRVLGFVRNEKKCK